VPLRFNSFTRDSAQLNLKIGVNMGKKTLLERIKDHFSWTFHNLVAHPASEILHLVGLSKASEWLHDTTIPKKDKKILDWVEEERIFRKNQE
jgi:hypothetical protein